MATDKRDEERCMKETLFPLVLSYSDQELITADDKLFTTDTFPKT